MKVLQVLEDIPAGRVAVNPLVAARTAIPVKAGDGKRADFELVHDRRVKLEF